MQLHFFESKLDCKINGLNYKFLSLQTSLLTSWQPHDSFLLMFRQYFDIELSYEANVLEV